jgi:hypothetical protein
LWLILGAPGTPVAFIVPEVLELELELEELEELLEEDELELELLELEELDELLLVLDDELVLELDAAPMSFQRAGTLGGSQPSREV